MSGGKTDTSLWEAIRRRVAALDKAPHVKVGVLAGLGDEDVGGVTLIELAAVHEFGSPAAGIPERSFIRSTFDQRRDELRRVGAELTRQIVAGRVDVVTALGRLGLWGANAVKRQITGKLVVPRLEDSEAGRRTIKRKGSSTTLVDTGRLVNSITWVVVP